MSERDVEVPWAIRNSKAPILDVGCAESTYLLDLPTPVDGIDVRPPDRAGLRQFFRGDIRTWEAPEPYPTVLAISTVEHIGLACAAYGTQADDPEGDVRAVRGCYRAVAPGGQLLISVPFGAPHHYGWFRQYDVMGVTNLCDPFTFKLEVWWRLYGGHWEEIQHLTDLEEAELLEYDRPACSARAVALITIEKPHET